MFFGKLFKKKKKKEEKKEEEKKEEKEEKKESTSIPSDAVIPHSRNVLLIGCPSYKKATLLESFCGEKEVEHRFYYSQENVEFKRKEFNVSSDNKVILNMWGITGNEDFGRVLYPYCRGAHGIIFFYETSNKGLFKRIKLLIEEIKEMLYNLRIPIQIAGISEKKGVKAVVPQKEVDALAKMIGAKASSCCLEDTKSVNELFRTLLVDSIKKYNTAVKCGKEDIDLPPPLLLEEATGSGEDSPSRLISLCKYKTPESDFKGVDRNENGLFGDYSVSDYPVNYNVCVLGCPQVGKSCLCARYLDCNGIEIRKSDTSWTHTFCLPNEMYLNLQMKKGNFPQNESDDVSNYSKAHAILLCYDITDRASFDALKGAVKNIKGHSKGGAVIVVVGLRYDDKKRVDVPGSEGRLFAEENGMHFRECSAVDGMGVSGVFAKVLLELHKIDCFALPISAEEANSVLPLSVPPVYGKKEKEPGTQSESLLDKIISEQESDKTKTVTSLNLNQEYDFVFKVMLVGDSKAGLTSLLFRLTDGTFRDSNIYSIGVDFMLRTFYLHSGFIVKLMVWDYPKSLREGFRTINSAPFWGNHALLICYDKTDMKSFENVKQWVNYVDRYGGKHAKHILVGTKADLTDKVAVDTAAASELAGSLGMPHFECSSKTGAGVDELRDLLVDLMTKKGIESEKQQQENK